MPNKTDIDPLSITDGKISNLANINPKKLAKATEGQILVAQADGRFVAKSLTGGVSLEASGATSVTSTTTTTDGETTVVTGPAGPTGAQGPVGVQGAQGPAGSDATVTTSAVDSAGAVMETDLVQASAGAGDASKPIKLDSTGKIDASMIDDGDISYNNIADVPSSFTPSAHASTHATGAADAIAPSDIGAEPAFTKNTAHNKNFGSTAGTVCQGNDSRLSDARTPLSHNHDHNALTNYDAAEHRVIDDSSTSDQDKLWSAYNITTNLALYTPLSTYSGHGHGQYAVKADNLSDLTNAGTARTNLGLGDSATKDVGTGSTNVAAGNHTHSTGNNGFVPAAGSSGQFLAHDGTFATPPDTNTQLSTEEVQDIVGGMFTGNTETNITATYQDSDGTIDLVASAGSGTVSSSETTDSDGDLQLAVYSASTTTKKAQDLIYNDSSNDFFIDCEVNINNGVSAGSSATYPLYVNGSIKATSYYGKTESTATHYVKPDAGDGYACLYGHGYVALKSMSSEPSMGEHYAGIYAINDTSSTYANLWAVGTDGSETQISPHDENGDWIFHSIDRKRGKRTKINMIEVIRALEEVTGDQYILEENL